MVRYVLFLVVSLTLGINQPLLGQSKKIDHQQLQKLLQFSDSTGANKAMVFHNSDVIGSFESEYCDSVYMSTASMIKSWTGLAVGILIDKGLIDSEDDKICRYVPEWKSGCENDVTIKHLLTMSSGLKKNKPASKSILTQDDMNKFALSQKIIAKPGSTFSYSNAGVQLIGILIENVSNKSANTFFQQNIFTPLGMDSTRLWQDKAGNDIVYGGAQNTTIQDASKIGLLMLNNGRYEDKRVVSKEWIQKSTTPSKVSKNYGYLWWLDPSRKDSPMQNYAAMGDLGRMTIIFPEKDLVYLRQQSCKHKDIPNMSWMGDSFIQLIGSVIDSN